MAVAGNLEQILRAKADPNSFSSEPGVPRQPLLVMALATLNNDDESTLQLLLRAKANPELCGDDEISPLEVALERPNFVEILLRARCDANRSLSSEGHTALQKAISSNQSKTLHILLREGANVNATTLKLQRTALFYCTKASQVYALLDARADPLQADCAGQLCAHRFVLQGETGAPCLYAICSRTNCDVPDNAGYTPLGLASSMGDAFLINLLVDFGHDGGRKVPSICALQNKHYKLFFKLSFMHMRSASRAHRMGVIVLTFLLLFGIYIGTWFVLHYRHPGRSLLMTGVATFEVGVFILVAIACAL
eukprot:GEMP01063465.1.p1 GENE.GEMP01063465.1~~GEMP01063465.1.p1  ORF type:complete len:308 (+),score=68.53 GEMP01063465.1:133-1056(+)